MPLLPSVQSSTENKPTSTKRPQKTSTDSVRGKPKSGRFWKNEKKKFSSVIKTRGLRASLQKKQSLREEIKRVKDTSRAIKAKREAERVLKKERRKENLERKEANRLKSEVVQVITNSRKIKRMKKKQLRQIEKRDTTNVNK